MSPDSADHVVRAVTENPSQDGGGVRWRRGRMAAAVLAFCCVCWGFSFPVMQMATGTLDRAMRAAGEERGIWPELGARASFNGWRFGLAAAMYFLMARAWLRRWHGRDWVGGALVGLFFGSGMFMQLVGLKYALPSVSSFLTALTVVFAPLAQSLIFRRPVGARTWAAVGVALVGIALLSRPNPDAQMLSPLTVLPPLPYLGEMLTILGAVIFTAQILTVDRYGQRADPIVLTCVALAACAAINLAGGAILAGREVYRADVLAAIMHDTTFLWAMAGLVFFSSVVALHLMNAYQPMVSAAAASVIYCLEPLFATMFSVLFKTETLTKLTAAGGTAVLIAVLMVAAAAGKGSGTEDGAGNPTDT